MTPLEYAVFIGLPIYVVGLLVLLWWSNRS